MPATPALSTKETDLYRFIMNRPDSVPEPLIAFLDANIVLEGRPMDELPWEEVASQGTIRVMIVPKAMEEIDAKKRDGRLGLHARSFNRLIAPSVIEGRPVVLREVGPRVELEMVTCSRIPWEIYDELDIDDGDGRIVAEALNARGVASSRRVLVSHDLKPLAFATGRGLPVHRASDAWLRPVEPGPKDREIQRLKQQVADFKKDEPRFDIAIDVPDGNPATVHRIAPLTEAQAASVTEAILARNPRQEQRLDNLVIGLSDYDSSYEDEYAAWKVETVPRFVAAFSEKLEMVFNQMPIAIRVTNSGPIRADHLVVSVTTSDGWINERIVVASPAGPNAPVPTPSWQRLQDVPSLNDFMQSKVGRHELEMTRRPRRSSLLKVSCEDFRSGQEYSFAGSLMTSRTTAPLVITVSVTAANLRGQQTETRRIEKRLVDALPGDLVDLATLRITGNFPIRAEMVRLIETGRSSEVEWDGSSGRG